MEGKGACVLYLPKETKRRCIRSIIVYGVIIVAAIIVAFTMGDGDEPAWAPIYQGDSGKNQVAITVNVDWGEEYIPAMLEILHARDLKVNFFLTGHWTERCPDVAKTIADGGMEIGNHGLRHRSPNSMTYEENVADILAAEAAIEAALSIKTTLFAPPSGEIEDQVLRAAEDLGYTLILWSADTIDWQKPEPATMVERIENKLSDGSIILMHPTENTVAALPAILDLIEERGFKVVPVSELIQENV